MGNLPEPEDFEGVREIKVPGTPKFEHHLLIPISKEQGEQFKKWADEQTDELKKEDEAIKIFHRALMDKRRITPGGKSPDIGLLSHNIYSLIIRNIHRNGLHTINYMDGKQPEIIFMGVVIVPHFLKDNKVKFYYDKY